MDFTVEERQRCRQLLLPTLFLSVHLVGAVLNLVAPETLHAF